MKASITVISIHKTGLNSEALVKERGVCSSHYRKERGRSSRSRFGFEGSV